MADYQGFADLERKGWTAAETSAGYVDLFSPASDMAVPALVAAMPAGAAVLDLCCGQGNVTASLLAAGHDATGVDFSPAMLDHARRRAPQAAYVEADAQDLPFADGAFGGVVSNFGLVHAPDQPRALREAARVLAPGGVFAMTAWCGPDVSPAFQVFFGSVTKHGDPSVALPEGPDFHQFADETTARALIEGAGLTYLRSERVACAWRLDRPEDLFEIFRIGAPRAGHLLRSQPPAAFAAVRAAFLDEARRRFADGDGLTAPVPATAVVARRD